MTLMQSEGLIEVADQQEMLAVLGRNDELGDAGGFGTQR